MNGRTRDDARIAEEQAAKADREIANAITYERRLQERGYTQARTAMFNPLLCLRCGGMVGQNHEAIHNTVCPGRQ